MTAHTVHTVTSVATQSHRRLSFSASVTADTLSSRTSCPLRTGVDSGALPAAQFPLVEDMAALQANHVGVPYFTDPYEGHPYQAYVSATGKVVPG